MNIDRYTFPIAALAIIAGLFVSLFNTGSTAEPTPAAAITAVAE